MPVQSNDIDKLEAASPSVSITRDTFLKDNQGRRFSDVVNNPDQPFSAVLEFFNDPNRQRRMEESEIHHVSLSKFTARGRSADQTIPSNATPV